MKTLGTILAMMGLLFAMYGQSQPADSNGTDLPISAGSLVTIKSYDVDSKTYTVFATAFPGEGDSVVTPEGLKIAIPDLDLTRALKFPKSIVGREYKIDRDLPTLFDEEVNERMSSKARSRRKADRPETPKAHRSTNSSVPSSGTTR